MYLCVSWWYLWGHPGTIPGTLGHNGHGTTPCTCVFHGGTCGDIPGQYPGRWVIIDMGPHCVLVCFMVVPVGTFGHNGHGTTPCTWRFMVVPVGTSRDNTRDVWVITDMGPHRVLVCFMVGWDIPGQYPGRWDIMDMGPHRVLVRPHWLGQMDVGQPIDYSRYHRMSRDIPGMVGIDGHHYITR